ncbi:MAG TPA: S-adenosylmethionine decarboxylase [Pirellulales bacterium]|nr:S-adenosylmethionine decarboxylase [Pirellulales bacterium]
MSEKKRGEEPRGASGGRDGGETPEVWHKEKPSRHKWFRKGKKRGDSRRSPVDEGADDEDAESGSALCESHIDLSYAAYAAGDEVMATAAREDAWGIASAIDIYDCDPELIRDAAAIRRFVAELCDLIEMKRFGETQVVHFGEDERVAGYSMVQLIETSLISGHFANQTNAVYLDVFSCKPYNPQIVREFSQEFFGGGGSSLQVAMRR